MIVQLKHNLTLVDACEDGLGPVTVALRREIVAGYLLFRMTSVLKPGYNSDRALYFQKPDIWIIAWKDLTGYCQSSFYNPSWMDWTDKTMLSLMMTVTTGVNVETLTRRMDVLATMQDTW